MKIALLGVQLTSLVIFRGPLIRDLIAAGHEVVAIAPERIESRVQELEAMGTRYIEAPLARTGLNPFRDIQGLIWLCSMFRREKPDVVLAFQAKAVIYGMPAAWLAGITRRIAMIEGLGQAFIKNEGEGLRRRIVQIFVPLLYRVSLRFAHQVIFLNPDDEADFIRMKLVTPAQAQRIPGIGVDLQKFTVLPLPAPEPFTFITNARLIVHKGIRDLMAAAAIVRGKYPQTRFLLIGATDSTHVGVNADEIRQHGIVEYVGFVTDIRPLLAKCHAFVLPTYYREGLPLSTVEAMATGRPVITTTAPGARETVIDQVNGYLVQPRAHEELAAAMIRLMESPAQLAEMGEASRKLAEERFDVAQINRVVMKVLGVET